MFRWKFSMQQIWSLKLAGMQQNLGIRRLAEVNDLENISEASHLLDRYISPDNLSTAIPSTRCLRLLRNS
jgi:hypothetical protein